MNLFASHFYNITAILVKSIKYTFSVIGSTAVSKTVSLSSSLRGYARYKIYKKISFDFNAGNTTVLKALCNREIYKKLSLTTGT